MPGGMRTPRLSLVLSAAANVCPPGSLWNPTIANLTLMALRSSAPEILLSVIEIVSNDFYSGDLGPSTIVDSAAFNGLMIISVCVSALEDGDVRKIEDFNVFAITATSSVFAYVRACVRARRAAW
eukprot:SAG22_NODE_5198_length_1063_cov_1.637967_2_plen_125_part_00